jgi:proteasome accessory factor B
MLRPTISRITIIHQNLNQNHFCSTKALCEEVGGVSRRTLLRDIQTLLNMGAPIQYDREHNGYYYQKDIRFEIPPMTLTEGDLMALILTEQAIASTDTNYLYKKLKPSLEKLRLLFQNQLQVAPDKIFSFGPCHQAELSPSVAKHMEKLLKAIQERKIVRLQYHSLWQGEDSERTVEPYHLRFHGKWYLAGYCLKRKDYRVFALPRIQSLELLKATFTPRDFQPENIFGQSWGIIKGKKTSVLLEFNVQTAPLIQETRWHPTQKLEPQKNGTLQMRLEVDGLDELLWWVLSFGSAVTVIEPEELRKRAKKEAKTIAEKY